MIWNKLSNSASYPSETTKLIVSYVIWDKSYCVCICNDVNSIVFLPPFSTKFTGEFYLELLLPHLLRHHFLYHHSYNPGHSNLHYYHHLVFHVLTCLTALVALKIIKDLSLFVFALVLLTFFEEGIFQVATDTQVTLELPRNTE